MANENKDGDHLESESGYNYEVKGDDSTGTPSPSEDGIPRSETVSSKGGTGSAKGGNSGGRGGGAQGAGAASESKGSHGAS